MKFVEHSYDELHNACVTYANMLQEADIKFEAVVALARGGTIPGTIISHVLDIPMEVLHYSSANGNGETKYNSDVTKLPTLNYKKILIVDDINDTGRTLNEVVNWYEKQNIFVGSYAIYFRDIPDTAHEPNYSIHLHKDDPWVSFPWEKGILNV